MTLDGGAGPERERGAAFIIAVTLVAQLGATAALVAAYSSQARLSWPGLLTFATLETLVIASMPLVIGLLWSDRRMSASLRGVFVIIALVAVVTALGTVLFALPARPSAWLGGALALVYVGATLYVPFVLGRAAASRFQSRGG